MNPRTGKAPDKGNGVATVLQNLNDSQSVALLEYTAGRRDRERLSYEDWVNPLRSSEGQLCLRFPSWDGAHFVRYRPDGQLKAVYAGPHGPENRPANIYREDIQQMLDVADDVSVVLTENSPFADVEVAGDA